MDHHTQDDVVTSFAVHEAVCAERWKQANARLARIEAVLGAIVLLLLFGDGSMVTVIKRWLGDDGSAAPSRYEGTCRI